MNGLLRKFAQSPLLVALLLIRFYAVGAQTPPAKETQIKAVFLYNFAQFAQWPDNKLPEPSAPLIIGILGSDPFGPFIDQVVAGEQINGHPIEIRRLKNAADVDSCHILFIGSDKANSLPEIIRSTRGKNIITVSDVDHFTRNGGMIKFFIEDNKVRFQVNMTEYTNSKVVLSSRLLRLAEICCE